MFHRLFTAGIICFGLTLPTSAPAQELVSTVKASGKDDTYFYGNNPKRFVNRGEHIYIGQGMHKKAGVFYFLRLNDQKRVSLSMPWKRYLRAHPELHYDHKKERPLEYQFRMDKLFFFDKKQGVVGFSIVDARPPKGKAERTIYMEFDIKKRRMSRVLVIAQEADKQMSSVHPLGYIPKGRQLFLIRTLKHSRAKNARRSAEVIQIAKGKLKVIASFDTKKYLYRRSAFDAKRKRVFLAEYAEARDSGKPTGYLVNLKSGKVKKTAVPYTPYGLVFGAQGKFLYAYGAQQGDLWQIRVAGLKLKAKKQVGGLGHAMGLVSKSQMVIIRNAGLQSISVPGFKKGKFVPRNRFYKNPKNVSGSLVGTGWAVIKTGEFLRTVRYGRKK